MFQNALLTVLESCLLPIWVMCCSLDSSTTQNNGSTLLHERLGIESSALIVWGQLQQVTWEGEPNPEQTSVHLQTRLQLKLMHRRWEEAEEKCPSAA